MTIASVSLDNNKKIIPNGILGIIFLLTSESMFFAGLISAYIVNRADIKVWPPVNQPRLPIEVTFVNTILFILSAVCFGVFAKKFKSKNGDASVLKYLIFALLLGMNFLIVQGVEWIKLIKFGLTTTSSLYGAFFYLIIGAHAVHVLAGLIVLFYLYFAVKYSDSISKTTDKIAACGLYWYFVVGIWPILYFLVYLV